MTEHLVRALDEITRVRGVRGAMLVAADDGLVIADSLMEGIRGGAVAALAASLATKLADAARASGIGFPQFVHLQADDGVLLAAPGSAAGTLLVTVASAEVNVGLARLEMARAVERLA